MSYVEINLQKIIAYDIPFRLYRQIAGDYTRYVVTGTMIQRVSKANRRIRSDDCCRNASSGLGTSTEVFSGR